MVGDNEELSERVVQATAAARSTDPLELPPLYDAVDPDALGALIEAMDDGEVVFSYDGCEITIGADGTVNARSSGASAPDSGSTPASD